MCSCNASLTLGWSPPLRPFFDLIGARTKILFFHYWSVSRYFIGRVMVKLIYILRQCKPFFLPLKSRKWAALTPKIALISSSGTPQVSGNRKNIIDAMTSAGKMKQR